MSLPNYKFELKDPRRDKTSIFFLFYFQGQKFKYGTSQIIYPELWDKERRRPTNKKTLIAEWSKQVPDIKTDLENIANRLENICSKTTEYFSLTERAGAKINLVDLRTTLDQRFKEEKKIKAEPIKMQQPPYISDLISSYVKGVINGTVFISSPKNRRGQKFSPATVDLYRSFEKVYKEFEQKYGQYRIDQISREYENALMQFFDDKKYARSQMGKLITRLKAILREYLNVQRGKTYIVEKEGKRPVLSTSDLFHISKELDEISKPSAKTQAVALYNEEIEKITKLDLTKKPYLKRTRDVFLAGYYTALRYSDFHRLDPSKHIKGDQIVIKAQKTKKQTKIDITKELKAILNQYPEGFQKITSQEIGRNIKEICRMAGIKEKVEIEERGQIVEKEKWQLITTHTARRSGATYMYEKGVPLLDIMQITGHTKLDMLQQYLIPRTTKPSKK